MCFLSRCNARALLLVSSSLPNNKVRIGSPGSPLWRFYTKVSMVWDIQPAVLPHDPTSQSPPNKSLSHLHLLSCHTTPRLTTRHRPTPRRHVPPGTPMPLRAHHHADVCHPHGRGEAEQSHGWLEHVRPLWPAVDHDQALAGRKELGQGSSWALGGGVALGGGEALSLR